MGMLDAIEEEEFSKYTETLLGDDENHLSGSPNLPIRIDQDGPKSVRFNSHISASMLISSDATTDEIQRY